MNDEAETNQVQMLRDAFYEKHERQVNLSDDDIQAILDSAEEDQYTPWFVKKMQEAEEAKKSNSKR